MIGAVKQIHVWTDRPTGWWPQSPEIRTRPPAAPAPSYVHWDEWLGTAPARPYAAKYYHPFNWRGWRDFGCGALGDMGCHVFNLSYMALKLGHPTAVRAESEEPNPETYPAWARVTYEFAERQAMPPVKLTWYEGHKDDKLVLPPEELVEKVVAEYGKVTATRGDEQRAAGRRPASAKRSDTNAAGLGTSGSIVVGDRGILYSATGNGSGWALLPAEDFRDYKSPPRSLPRNPLAADPKTIDEGHKAEWLAAVKGGPAPLSNFDYAGMLTECVLLGNVAIRAGGARLEWDGPNLKIPNMPEAEKWLKREYREPWKL
jgi:predicted dehydrogenase